MLLQQYWQIYVSAKVNEIKEMITIEDEIEIKIKDQIELIEVEMQKSVHKIA